MKTIALIDIRWSGHHPTYFKLFTKTLLELGYQVIALCPNPAELNEWIISNCSNQTERFYPFQLQKPDDNLSLIGRYRLIYRFYLIFTAIKRWQHTASTLQKACLKIGISPDLVFFTYLDSYLGSYLTHNWVDKIFPYKWSGLYFQPRHLRGQRKFEFIRHGFLNPHAVLQSSYCQSVAILDEGVAEKLQNSIKDKPIVIFPDFTDESPPDTNFIIAKEVLQKAKGRKIIGLLGALEKRKGLLTLLKIAQLTLEEDWFFIFVGELKKYTFMPKELIEIEAVFNSDTKNCFFHLERIPNESQFNALVDLCDILFAVYDYPHSSNILTKAAIFEKPVIVGDEFCMAERVRQFQLGFTVNEKNTTQCIEAIRQLCDKSDLNNTQIQLRFKDYRRAHSIEQLHLKFQEILARYSSIN